MALSDNLIGRWCPSIDDSANDISGSGFHGTYAGGMGTVADTGAGGTRAYQAGSMDIGDVALDGFATLSVSYWVNWNGSSSFHVAKDSYNTSTSAWYVGRYTSTRLNMSASNSNYTYKNSVVATGWKHFLAVYDSGSKWRLWVDGSLQTGLTEGGTYATLIDSAESMTILVNGSMMDDIAIWNADKSADIATLYNSGSGRGLSYGGGSSPKFTQLERQIRGVNRGVYSGY